MAFDKILIANRGEIARRIQRTCHQMGYRTVAITSEADIDAPFVWEADEAICVGPPPSAQSYLAIDAIIEAAKRTGAGAIHPGYGFLAENADFAAACEDNAIVFVGPRSETIRAMGSKIAAKALMAAHGVPIIPGYDGAEQGVDALVHHGRVLGFPLLVKASAGGGGKGMRIVRGPAELATAIEAAKREAASAFGDDTLLLERYIDQPRHIEFQILGDTFGHVVHCFERECSIQRRHQKIIEETPCVLLEANPELRARMGSAAIEAGRALGYRSAGTVEFIVAPDLNFYFLEVNTRLQVEHPVTEATTGLDLVRLQLMIAEGQPLAVLQEDIEQLGHAIECRLYAEDPRNDFLPQTGVIHAWSVPELDGLRVDSGVEAGSTVSVHYDPMLAKFVTWGPSREEATRLMTRALREASIQGVKTNRRFLIELLQTDAWMLGELDTHFIERHDAIGALRRPTPPMILDHAAIAATLFDVCERAPQRRVPHLRPGWRNNPWRDTEQRWHADGQDVEVRYRSVGGDAYVVSLGSEAERDDAWRAWLATKYPSTDALREAWSEGKRKGLRDDETLENVDRLPATLLMSEKYAHARLADLRAYIASTEIPVVITRRAHGALGLAIAGHLRRFCMVAEGEARWVHVAGHAVELERSSRFPDYDDESAGAGAVAPMPGKVLQVLVAPGMTVESGQALVILEAMKMELTVSASASGVVDGVFVEQGQLVDAGTVLVSFVESAGD